MPTRALYAKTRCIHHLFEEQVRRSPHTIALQDGTQHYTYAELDAQANQLARYLRAQGVGPEVIVGCHLSRSSAIVECMLAILKAGGTYLLLDPLLPARRLHYLIKDAEPALIMTDATLPALAQKAARRVVGLGEAMQQAQASLATVEPSAVQPENAAYIAYTSGSTGRPKGVIITHQATVNHSQDFAQRFTLSTTDRVPLMAPIAFDMATEEIIPALMSGCTLVVSASQHTDMAAFTDEILTHRYTILNIPAPLWHSWTEYLLEHALALPPSLRLVIVGSDKIHTKFLQAWKKIPGADRVAWVAAYGTTETTVSSSFYMTALQDNLDHEPVVPIGKPITNTSFYILDKNQQPVEQGQVGELYIGGAGLARGYYKLDAKTRECFLPDPFAHQPDARMYKTGDLARARADGTVVCLGREDLQVKRNGLRIELGEIEAVLTEHPAVHEAVAVLQQQGEREIHKQLVAFVVPRDEHPSLADRLRAFATEHLHRHMVPDVFVMLNELPVNATGKLDRKVLEGYTTA